MQNWSWDIIEEFLKKIPLTTKIFKAIILNLDY